jgi:hypothetical protein
MWSDRHLFLSKIPDIMHSTLFQKNIALCLTLGLASAGGFVQAVRAAEFSADIVSRDPAGLAMGAAAKLYVSNHKVRIETPEASAGFLLIDGDAGTAQFVRPTQHVFMDAKQSSRLTQIFVPLDPKDPCRRWQAAAATAGAPNAGGEWRCERIDDELVADRRAIRYQVASEDSSSLRWIDTDLEFPVKLLAADGTMIALEHIRIEAQPASLFDIPAGFRKLDPRALIERIKHSDAWVDP